MGAVPWRRDAATGAHSPRGSLVTEPTAGMALHHLCQRHNVTGVRAHIAGLRPPSGFGAGLFDAWERADFESHDRLVLAFPDAGRIFTAFRRGGFEAAWAEYERPWSVSVVARAPEGTRTEFESRADRRLGMLRVALDSGDRAFSFANDVRRTVEAMEYDFRSLVMHLKPHPRDRSSGDDTLPSVSRAPARERSAG